MPTMNKVAFNQPKIPSQLNFLAPSVFDHLIRLGRKNDGGYVVPQLILEETEFLLSLGISDDWSFDEHFLSLRPHLRVHAYDHTISKKIFTSKIVRSAIKLFLGKSSIREISRAIKLRSAYKKFFTGNVKHFQERIHNRRDDGQDATFQMIFDRIDSERVFLKMDIEGSEYRVIDDLLKHSSRIIAMAIEFHDTDPLRLTFCDAVRRLQDRYEIVHLHANNMGPIAVDLVPETLEITFLRKEFCSHTGKRSKLPIDLDEPNDPVRADYSLNFDKQQPLS